jgi:hypothetical protein
MGLIAKGGRAAISDRGQHLPWLSEFDPDGEVRLGRRRPARRTVTAGYTIRITPDAGTQLYDCYNQSKTPIPVQK